MAAGAPSLEMIEPIPRSHVGEKIPEPDIAPVSGAAGFVERNDFGFGIDSRSRCIKQIVIDQRIVKKNIRVGQHRHGERQIAAVEQLYRLVALHVAQLAVVIRRDEKHAMTLPLEDFLRALACPHTCQSSALKHVDNFIDGHAERW